MIYINRPFHIEELQYSSNHFSMEKPTQSINKKLLIEQSSKGLNVSVQEANGKIHQVLKCFIEGLPKTDLVPKEFFESCWAKVVKTHFEYKVCFMPRLLGGGGDVSKIALAPAAVVCYSSFKPQLDSLKANIDHQSSNIDTNKNILEKSLEKISDFCKKIQILFETFHKRKNFSKNIDFDYLNKELTETNLNNTDFLKKNIEKRLKEIKAKRESILDLRVEFNAIKIELNKLRNSLEKELECAMDIKNRIDQYIYHRNKAVEEYNRIARTLEDAHLDLLFIMTGDGFKNFGNKENIVNAQDYIKQSQKIIEKLEENIKTLDKKDVELVSLTSSFENLKCNMETNKCALIVRNIQNIGTEKLKIALINGEKLDLLSSKECSMIDF